MIPVIVLRNPKNLSLTNVNSSDFWDDLDDPTDISGSEFWYNQTNLGQFLNLSGTNANQNIDIGDNNLTAENINQSVTTSASPQFQKLFLTDQVTGFDFEIEASSNIQDGAAKLTIDTQNVARTLTVSGNNVEIGDWFNQCVKTTCSPNFDDPRFNDPVGLTYRLDFSNQDYKIANRGGYFLVSESQEPATQYSFEHVTQDHDETDNVNSIWWASGDPIGNSVGDRSLLQNGFITAAAVKDRYWKLQAASAGTGNSYPLIIYTEANTNQIRLQTDGGVMLAGVYDDDIGTERDLLINASGSLGYDSSSIAFKENIKNMTDELSSKIYDLRPVTYDKINGADNQIGLIAEEVYKLYPEFISYKREAVMGECIDSIDNSTFECVKSYGLERNKTTGEYIPETISYKMLVTPLIQEVQNLKAENDLLRNCISNSKDFLELQRCI